MASDNTSDSTTAAHGILPDEVIQDPSSEASLIFITLDPKLDRDGVQAWLRALTAAVAETESPVGGTRMATVAVGVAPSFFATGGTPRFDLTGRQPHEFSDLPQVPGAATVAGDVVLYVLARSRAKIASLLLTLWATRSLGLLTVSEQQGFKRGDDRELFGFRDGLRNVASLDRPRVVFVNADDTADEPDWTDLGSYMAYLKIPQQLDAWAKLPSAEQERRIGRTLADGTRQDLAPGTDPHTEGDYTGDIPVPAAHVRKAAPHGGLKEEIFRRGVPFVEVDAASGLRAGLNFVSFQASLDAFQAILIGWMLRPDFKKAGDGADLLFADNMVTIEKAGFFFVPPTDPRFIGARIFDAPQPRRGHGHLFVRKKLVDTAGNKIAGQLDGAVFQALSKANGRPIGATFTTDASGHAVSPDLPVGVPLVLHEITPLPEAQPADDRDFQLDGPHGAVEVRNIQPTPQPPPYRP
jgi:Dyp-type peroxidase family